MEELKNEIISEINNTNIRIIKWLIVAIVCIALMFSFSICFITYQSYDYDYETVPDIENTNTNNLGGNK